MVQDNGLITIINWMLSVTRVVHQRTRFNFLASIKFLWKFQWDAFINTNDVTHDSCKTTNDSKRSITYKRKLSEGATSHNSKSLHSYNMSVTNHNIHFYKEPTIAPAVALNWKWNT